MTKQRDDLDRQIALFRHGVLGDLGHRARNEPGLYKELEKRGARPYEIPGTLRTRVAPETIRGWLRAYRQGGFDALLPKRRGDAGATRKIPPDVADLLVTIKDEHPAMTVAQVIEAAREVDFVADDLLLPLSTVHRLLTRAGVMRPNNPDGGEKKDRRRFSYTRAGELWMSDVMHGPAVVTQGKRKRKTYLVAFIDDATRVVPHAAFALGENTGAFMPVFKQAILRRGIPKRLFVDNGSAYRSQHLQLVTARLGTTLIHARVRDAAAKGKQERWFRTVRMQLLPRLRETDLRNLEALNRRLWVYIEQEYHRAPHRGIDGDTPLQRWATCADDVRYVGPETDLEQLFLQEARRKVRKDRTVSLEGHVYEVDAMLVGETVALRYDPERLGRPIQVWHRDRHVHDARLVDTHANCFVKRNKDAPERGPIRLSGFDDATAATRGRKPTDDQEDT